MRVKAAGVWEAGRALGSDVAGADDVPRAFALFAGHLWHSYFYPSSQPFKLAMLIARVGTMSLLPGHNGSALLNFDFNFFFSGHLLLNVLAHISYF